MGASLDDTAIAADQKNLVKFHLMAFGVNRPGALRTAT
jgi:hypothetical protein